MAWERSIGTQTADVTNDNLRMILSYDEFSDGTAEGRERALRGDLLVRIDGEMDQNVGFRIYNPHEDPSESPLTSAELSQLKALLVKCRDFGLTSLGFEEV